MVPCRSAFSKTRFWAASPCAVIHSAASPVPRRSTANSSPALHWPVKMTVAPLVSAVMEASALGRLLTTPPWLPPLS